MWRPSPEPTKAEQDGYGTIRDSLDRWVGAPTMALATNSGPSRVGIATTWDGSPVSGGRLHTVLRKSPWTSGRASARYRPVAEIGTGTDTVSRMPPSSGEQTTASRPPTRTALPSRL